jgi:hypothetical protein
MSVSRDQLEYLRSQSRRLGNVATRLRLLCLQLEWIDETQARRQLDRLLADAHALSLAHTNDETKLLHLLDGWDSSLAAKAHAREREMIDPVIDRLRSLDTGDRSALVKELHTLATILERMKDASERVYLPALEAT